MTSETAYEDVVVVPEDLAEVAPMSEMPSYNEWWYDGHFFYAAYINAAEALRDEAKRAFVLGRDEIAFLLRERANELEDYGKRESSDWEKGHRSK